MRKEIKREQKSITWVNEKGAKTLRSVNYSVSLQSWMNQRNCSKVNELAQVLGKKSSHYIITGCEIWYVFLFFFPENCCNHRSKRIEAVRFHHISCWSWNKVSLYFVRTQAPQAQDECFLLISLCFICWYFEVESLPDKTYHLFSFNDRRRDDRWKKFIVNTTLRVKISISAQFL